MGASVGRLVQAPVGPAITAGVACTWGATLLLDHRRWANSRTSISRGNLAPEAWPVAIARLREAAIDVTYEEILDDDSGDRRPAIACREADAAVVSAVLAELEA